MKEKVYLSGPLFSRAEIEWGSQRWKDRGHQDGLSKSWRAESKVNLMIESSCLIIVNCLMLLLLSLKEILES